jgi:ABC-2 family transporter protein
MRLVSAELLKLRRRTGLVLSTFGLTIVPALIMLAVADDGGLRGFSEHFGVLALLTVVAGILVGAMAGTADEASGVFRDLVVTGRSRLDLFAARAPAGLVLVLLAAGAGFAIIAAESSMTAGSVPTSAHELGTIAPTAGLLLKSAALLALVAAVSFALALGVASVVGSTGGSIAVLLALWLVVTPLIQSVDALDWLEDGLVVAGVDRFMPADLIVGEPSPVLSLGGAIAVLLAWSALPLLAGAWRTMTRDA